jgi:site-specific DNA recombinase
MTLTLIKETDKAEPEAVKRAVLYLRVSSRGQLETDYDDDGLSIAAQRERCAQKAAEYDAVVIDEYVERAQSAKTNDRPELNAMLARIKEQRDIDYVICWKVDRFARDRRDDANMLFEIEASGARLISATENIDHTPAGRLMHGMLATFAEYYSRNLANEVLKGMTEKAKRGGTPGRAPLGYLNVREALPQGGEVRTVGIDPERGPIVVWAFETYATGLYSLGDIALLVESRGLRTRGDRKHPPRPLDLKRIHEMLSNPYYTGIVSYRGKSYPGRHAPLISQDLFDQVQAVLSGHRHAGERNYRHQHALTGTVRCGVCGSGLVYSRNKGNGGTYEYFVCIKYQRGECPQGYIPVDLIEAAVENHYRTVVLSDAERDEIRRSLAEDLGERLTTARQEVDRCKGVLEDVKEQERKLLHMHYEDRITGELFDDEQARLRREREAAESLIKRLDLGYQDIQDTLDLALEIISDDLHGLYRRADDTVRRLINQAIFKAIYIHDDEVVHAELAVPFAQLHAIAGVVDPTTGTSVPGEDAKVPDPWQDREPLAIGYNVGSMVEPTGIEPVTSCLQSARPRARCAAERCGFAGGLPSDERAGFRADARGLPGITVDSGTFGEECLKARGGQGPSPSVA